MKIEDLKIGNLYYCMMTPEIGLIFIHDIDEIDEHISKIEEYVFIKNLSYDSRGSDLWFAVKDTKRRILLNKEQIENNLFESRIDAEEFQKKYYQTSIEKLNKYIDNLQLMKQKFSDKITEMESFGPLFQS